MKREMDITILGGNYRRINEWGKDVKNVFFSSDDFKIGSKKTENLAKIMIDVIYLKLFPANLARFLESSCDDFFRREIMQLIANYANYDVVYNPSGEEMPKHSSCKNIIFVNPKLLLINQKISMPLGDFIIWHKKGEYRALAEWSGVPVKSQNDVYDSIIDFFRRTLVEKNSNEIMPISNVNLKIEV